MCDHQSDHVVSLDLGNRRLFQGIKCDETKVFCFLSGKIHPSLFKLQHLQYLDLSWNDFQRTAIHSQLAKLQWHTFLSLKFANFTGDVPLELSNITTLRHLDLSWNDFSGTAISPKMAKLQRLTFLNLVDAQFQGEIPLELGNITTLRYLELSRNTIEIKKFAGCIRNLRSLEYLDLSFVNFSMENERWSNAISSLSNIREIHSFDCRLSGTIPSLLNLTHLSCLDLLENSFYSQLPPWFQNISSFPSNFLHLSSLSYLDLSAKYLGGVIPQSIANFSRLDTLLFSDNNLTGDLPPFGSFIGRLYSLVHLDLSNN
ncbi:hypothetical protein SUGI_0874140 [Cryptomeria japonica]|nr:hypothetical protein SUGI_0874140 [Cryptomeria japonica]